MCALVLQIVCLASSCQFAAIHEKRPGQAARHLTLHEVPHWVLHADELRAANLLVLDAELGLHPNLGLLVIHSINR